MPVARLVLNEERVIRGRKVPVGTLLGEVTAAAGFELSDADKAMRSGAVKFEVPAAPPAKKEARVPAKAGAG